MEEKNVSSAYLLLRPLYEKPFGALRLLLYDGITCLV